jgi:hypothetical protein
MCPFNKNNLSIIRYKITKNMQKKMSFSSAIEEVIRGKKIARISWPKGEYGAIKDGFLAINRLSGIYKWNINDGDLLANDWIIYES